MSETVTQVSDTEQKIVRSRTCGCRDFYIAKLTQNDAKAYVAETRSNWQEQSKQRLTKSGVLKRFTLTMEQRKSSIPMREQKSNLRSMHSHHRTDRFFSVSYTRTVFL